MSTLNKAMLIGHLGDDVKMHYFEGGGCVGRFPLATNESYTNKQTGDKVTSTDWHNIVVRNKTAEVCEKYLSKGDKVYVEGKIKTRKYQAEDGSERYATEIQVDNFKFLTKKGSQTPDSTQGSAPQSSTPLKPEDPDDDLPF